MLEKPLDGDGDTPELFEIGWKFGVFGERAAETAEHLDGDYGQPEEVYVELIIRRERYCLA